MTAGRDFEPFRHTVPLGAPFYVAG
ncbi:MAG: hypothetical protein QOI54_2774, partial [Actinomycetota bacterium]|nr:hypothetical protein [Actinomycetota bacterium]